MSKPELTYESFIAGRYHEPAPTLLTHHYCTLGPDSRHRLMVAGFETVMDDTVTFDDGDTDGRGAWAPTQTANRALAALVTLEVIYDAQVRTGNLVAAWLVLESMLQLFAVTAWLHDTFDHPTPTRSTVAAELVQMFCATPSDADWDHHAITICEHLQASDPDGDLGADARLVADGLPPSDPTRLLSVANAMAVGLHVGIDEAIQHGHHHRTRLLVASAAGVERLITWLRDGQGPR
jgi:hypothetical protein